MTKYRKILHVETGQPLLTHAQWCHNFAAKLRGFTFRRRLGKQEGLVLVEKRDSRMTTAIHMLFVFFDLGVIWVNDAGVVVDTVLAKPWRLSYAPAAPARYVIEGHPNLLTAVRPGDHIQFIETT